MASLASYLEDLRTALRPALCLHNFPSTIERQTKPLIETEDPSSSGLVLPPREVVRSPQESALIEQSVNSTRLSLRFKTTTAEEYLLHTFLKFMMHRADQLDIVRRVALPGYHITLLITASHLERYQREGLINFIVQFVEDLHAEVNAMKLGLRSRARAVVAEYWQQLERRHAVPRAAAAAAISGS